MYDPTLFLIVFIICLFMFCMVAIIACIRLWKHIKSGGLYTYPAPVVVTSTHTTTAGYPTTVAPTPSGGYQAAPYPTAMPMPMGQPGGQPYPLHPGAMPMPMSQAAPYPPPNIGFQTHAAPYPPEIPPSQVNPPSYDQVVASESYAKQAPYNPNYPAAGH